MNPTVKNSSAILDLAVKIKALRENIHNAKKFKHLLKNQYVQATAERYNHIADQKRKYRAHAAKLGVLRRARPDHTDSDILRLIVVVRNNKILLLKLQQETTNAYKLYKEQQKDCMYWVETWQQELGVLMLLHTLNETTSRYQAEHGHGGSS